VAAGFGPSSNVSATADESPVCLRVGPKSCAEGATAAHENTPPAAHNPAAPSKAGMECTMQKFSHAPPRRTSKSGGCARLYSPLLREVRASIGNAWNTQRTCGARLASGFWLQGYPETKPARLSSPGLLHLFAVTPPSGGAEIARETRHSSQRNGMSLYIKKNSTQDSNARESIKAYTEAIQSDLRNIQTRNWS
jgi:hypothetical protein